MDAFDDEAEVTIPRATIEPGRLAYARDCARCHGRMAGGTREAPNLLEPALGKTAMPDDAYRKAVLHGVAQRSSVFGAMPAMPWIKRQDLNNVIDYLRELQRRSGVS